MTCLRLASKAEESASVSKTACKASLHLLSAAHIHIYNIGISLMAQNEVLEHGHVQDSTRLEALLTWMEEEPVQGSIFFVVCFWFHVVQFEHQVGCLE